ncbi:hypothetical protein ACJRPK_05385 [Aquimarina sp. 2-A2]|uniref:hypothetical protein n=1 Tax=Aquimarina sp. 2-A2 TaxID=3382644 RepID=UPI00387F2E79
MKYFTIILLSISLLSSCYDFAKKNEILILNNDLKDTSLKIDGQEIPLDTLNQFTKLSLKNGNYKIEPQKIYGDSIKIKENSLITSNHNQFVIFPIYYESKPISGASTFPNPSGPIILDSTIVVFDAEKFKNIDELIKGIEVYYDFENVRIKKGYPKADVNEKPKLRLITPKKSIVSKSWDNTLQDLPEYVEVRKTTTNEIFGVSKNLEVLTELKNFMYLSKETKAFKGVRVKDSNKLALIKNYLKKRYDIIY